MMTNKGVTKFWIEIIGGVIIVVIILVIILFVATKTSAMIEDTAAVNSMQIFTQTMAKATTSGTQVTSPWRLSMSRDNSVYAIVYATQNLTNLIKLMPGLTSSSNFTLTKCDVQDLRDTCLCLFYIKYADIRSQTCDDLPFNVIVVENGSSYDTEKANINNWSDKFPLNTIQEIQVLECTNIKSICSWTDNKANTWPCLIHYQGKPVVWMSAQGGDTGFLSSSNFDTLLFEILEMTKEFSNYYIDMNPTLAVGSYSDKICASLNCKPCYGCKTTCNETRTGSGCSNAFEGINCSP